ncbi:MAG: hypothetical protein HYS27_24060 [Deltaproteobacteria bacterium]|nr:hypothetical protein [Deltaproteobacteria bacterium]
MNVRDPRVIAGIALALALVIGGAIWLSRRPSTSEGAGPTASDGPSTDAPEETSAATAPYDTKQQLEVQQDKPRAAALVVDVLNPSAVRTAIFENGWLSSAGTAPLGRGYLGSWAAFLGSARGDVGLSGAGLVRDAIVDALVQAPVRVVLFEGDTPMPPALITASSPATSTALKGLTLALQRGGFIVDACPGETAEVADAGVLEAVDGGEAPPPLTKQRIEIVRWVVAEHDLYLADTRGRVVLARSPRAVVNGVCTTLPELTPAPGVDVQLRPQVAGLGRPADVLTRMLGLGTDVALSWKVEGTRLVPVGIGATVEHGDRLDAAPLPASLLAAVPADTAVALAAGIKLPAKLDEASLAAAWGEGGMGEAGKTRTVIALWQPRGDAKAPTEVALLWSDPADKDALRALFSGKNAMSIDEVCGGVALSSTAALLSRIKASCKGTTPSIAFAEPAVVAGLKEAQSVSLVVDLGAVLTALLEDGWRAERAAQGAGAKDKDKALPTEIDDARKLLDQLPRQGLVGTKSGASLQPRGYSS